MKKTSKKEASLVLQDKIKSLIIKQNLKSGDLMPTENELIEQLGVSRSSLREAIKSLEALHILDICHGVGTFVSESSLVPMIRGLSFHTQLKFWNTVLLRWCWEKLAKNRPHFCKNQWPIWKKMPVSKNFRLKMNTTFI